MAERNLEPMAIFLTPNKLVKKACQRIAAPVRRFPCVSAAKLDVIS